MTEEAAKKAIEQFLLTDRKRKLVSDSIKKLRESAKIEYVGTFANAAPVPAEAASAAAEVTPTVAPTAPASDALDAATLQKGLGLK